MTAPATVEAQPDPRTPGRTGYRVTSLHSPAAVQQAVAEIMSADGVAVAEFTHVRRAMGGSLACAHWMAVGYTLARQPDEVAA